MILVTFDLNGTPQYWSKEYLALTHKWKQMVKSFGTLQRVIETDYGGYCPLKTGEMEFKPSGFSADWPPPVSGAIEIKHTLTTEAAANSMLIGMAHISKYTKKGVFYNLYGPDYDEEIADATAYNDTLNNVITAILTSIAEINSVDTTYARTVSPNVTYTVSGDQLAIDLASAIAAFYSHMPYIIGDTAYLIDMKKDNGTPIALGYKYMSPAYSRFKPVAIARSGDFSRTSAYTYGKEISITQYHTTEANVNTALDDIIATLNMPRATVTIPLRDLSAIPLPGQKITWTDDKLVQDTDAWIRARILKYKLFDEYIEVEGEGGMSLTS